MGRNSWYLTSALCEALGMTHPNTLHFEALPHLLAQPQLQRVMSVLNTTTEETRLVGGAVRNALIGREVSDIDLATTALPDVIIALCTKAGIRTIPTGYEHGTITALIDGKTFEITTLREDIATDGRRATVAFGRSFAHDAARRDLTINALSLDAQGHVHDYVGGLDDLSQGRVRFIGQARERVREDYLRAFRFFRFHSAYALDDFDREALSAISAEKEGLRSLSKERIRAEYLKLLITPRASEVVEAMNRQGLHAFLFSPRIYPKRLHALITLTDHLHIPPHSLLRLAALAVGSKEAIGVLRDNLRLSNQETQWLHKIDDVLERTKGTSTPTSHVIKLMLYLYGRDATSHGLLLAHSMSNAAPDDPNWSIAHKDAETTAIPVFPLTGADLIARGYKTGPDIGRSLKQAEMRWIEADFPSSDQAITALLADKPPHYG